MAYVEILTFSPKPAINQAPVVVPMLEPKIIPIPAFKPMSSALKNEMVIKEINTCRLAIELPANTIDYSRKILTNRKELNKHPDTRYPDRLPIGE